MKTITCLFLLLISLSASAQILYSKQIPKTELSILHRLESKLKSRPFTLPRIILTDTVAFNDPFMDKENADFYNGLVKEFSDTTLIRKIPELQSLSFEKQEKKIDQIKSLTVSLFTSLHNIINCVDNKLLFIMPASEYALTDTAEKGFDKLNKYTYLGGYFKNKCYYPVLLLQFSEHGEKIVLMSVLVYFDKLSPEKEAVYEKYIQPYLEKCERQFKQR